LPHGNYGRAKRSAYLIEQFQQTPEALDLKRTEELATEERRLARLIFAETLISRTDEAREIARSLGFQLKTGST
jgi:hypothetical protein